MDVFFIEYIKEKTLFQNVAILDFESFCIPSEELTPTKLVNWIGKHEPISVSISFNLLDKPIFLRVKDPQFLIQLLAEKKTKGRCDQSFLKLRITSKRNYLWFSRFLTNKTNSIKWKQNSTKTNVLRTRKKRLHLVISSGFRKIN